MAFAMFAEFHPAATAELEASADWYAERSNTAAQNFLVAVDLAVASIVTDPSRFALVDDRHRSCSVAKFPFQVVFQHDNERVFILAVAHAKRRPGYWSDR